MYGNPGTRIRGYPCPPFHAAAQTQIGEQIVYGNPATRVPGSGSASNAPHPVGCPVPNFEAGVQLYSLTMPQKSRWWGTTSTGIHSYIIYSDSTATAAVAAVLQSCSCLFLLFLPAVSPLFVLIAEGVYASLQWCMDFNYS